MAILSHALLALYRRGDFCQGRRKPGRLRPLPFTKIMPCAIVAAGFSGRPRTLSNDAPGDLRPTDRATAYGQSVCCAMLDSIHKKYQHLCATVRKKVTIWLQVLDKIC